MAGMLPATTALMILKTHDDDLRRDRSRSTTARRDLRRRQRRFQQRARLRALLA